MARITPCLENGKTAMVNVLEEGTVGFGSTEFIVFRAIPGVSDPYFLYYLICSPVVREPAIKSMVGSSGRQRVQIDVIQKIQLSVPPLSEQIKIGDILKKLDDKISVNNQINQNLQELAFTLFSSMLLDHDGEDLCELITLAEINPKRIISKNAEARCIDMTKLSTSGAFPEGWEYKTYTGGMKFMNGDTILARITPCLENGKTAFINFLNEGEVAFGSTEYIVLTPKGNTPPELPYCLARYPKFIDYAVKNMNGTSGRQRVSGEVIGQYKIPCFTDKEMKTFKDATKTLFEKIRSNAIENMRLVELRDSLLPKLLSGELDVSDLDI